MIGRTDDMIAEAPPVRAALFTWSAAGWTGKLALFLRLMAVVAMFQGLYHWAAVCGFIGEEGGFEAHVPSWQTTTVFFAIIDLVAAVGLWLVAPWGAVVWLTSSVSMIVIQVFFEQVYGTNMLVILASVLGITAYLGLAVMAAKEHPR